MRARHLCAVLGVAIAIGAVTFVQSLVRTNDHQATAVAARLLEHVPVATDAEVAQLSLDYRPNGRVMQGPPLVASLATHEELAQKCHVGECVVTRALFTQRRLAPPPVGTELTFLGRSGAYQLKIAAILDWEKPLRGYPNVFVSKQAAETIGETWKAWEPKTATELAPGFRSDAGRNFDRAKGLLLWAAALTALCLLVNSLFLSIEAKRKDIAVLRMIGMTRAHVVKSVFVESVILAVMGAAIGIVGALGALWVYVACDAALFPLGMAVSGKAIALCSICAVLVAALAALMALKSALSVKPLEAASNRLPRTRHIGMFLSFAFGFGAFVAVEVWGASLMKAFVPSPEWPDAIVSILPGGVSSFEIEKLQGGKLAGVKRIHELAPLQVNLEPLEELKGFGAGRRGVAYRNVLLLGSDYLPNFTFVAGDHESATKAIQSGDACIITEMMARARKLKLGDMLKLDAGRGLKVSLKIVGIVDLNWHMVTSRGLVRGLNRMPGNTDGPAFVSFDTIEVCDPRPSPMVQMTHVWLDYEKDFLARHGVFEAGRIVEKEIVRALDGAYRLDEDDQVFGNTVRLHARDEIADGTLAHGADLIGSMARVPFIFVAVVSLGFIALLIASVESRKRSFVVLRSIGATRGQIAKILIGEALKIAAWGILFGLVGGALVGWLCTSGTRAAMANWGIPPCFAVPYLMVAKGALGAIVFSLMVAVPTALLLVRRAFTR